MCVKYEPLVFPRMTNTGKITASVGPVSKLLNHKVYQGRPSVKFSANFRFEVSQVFALSFRADCRLALKCSVMMTVRR